MKVWCILGPTASGKSSLAMHLAEHFKTIYPVEIISVDSALVYRGMDIGTAKPSLADQAQVPHHLIDIIEPSETYSAAKFITQASEKIQLAQTRGHLPL